jgi:hypothetical protein
MIRIRLGRVGLAGSRKTTLMQRSNGPLELLVGATPMPRTLSLISLAFLLLLPLGLSAPAVADGPVTPRRLAPRDFPSFAVGAGTTAGQCSAELVYDDGELDGGLAFTADTLDLVMRFDLGSPGARIDGVCVCWTRDSMAGPNTDLPFDIVVYDVAQNGEPGQILAAVTETADNVPAFVPDSTASFYSYDLSDEDIVAPGDQVYVGVSWFANSQPEFFACTDDDGTGNQPLFFSDDLGTTWRGIREFPPSPGDQPNSLSRIDALMIRTSLDMPDREPFQCEKNDTTLCLADGRFEVKVDWATNQGTSGVGMAKELTPDTGYFWFFEESNVEMVIKVLDACSFADRFWVFAGGLTNVEATITVTDSFTGAVRTFKNPLNTAFQPIQNTDAFDTCDVTSPP